MTVSQGDNISGRLLCSPNARNNRDLDITITYRAGNDADNTIHYKMCVFLLGFVGPAFMQIREQTLIGYQVLILSTSSHFDCLITFTHALYTTKKYLIVLRPAFNPNFNSGYDAHPDLALCSFLHYSLIYTSFSFIYFDVLQVLIGILTVLI